MKNIVVLGSTGSIGTQTLDVVRHMPEKLHISVLAAGGGRPQLLAEQIKEFKPEMVVVFEPSGLETVQAILKDEKLPSIQWRSGMEGLIEAVQLPQVQVVVTSLVGMIGIRPTVAAIEAGKDIALANKETLVCAGAYIMNLAKEKGVQILPVDSEHGAIFQCLAGVKSKEVHKIILTASGGPFFGMSRDQLETVTKADALKHPNWKMGAKITIDCATLMNKGLEVIEAMRLYRMPIEQVDVVVHRQSIIHSMVEFVDGAVVAQMGAPDMRLPIQLALTYPERMECPVEGLDLLTCGDLTFAKPDLENFPCLALAYKCGKLGGTACPAMNGANEEAVAMYLRDEIGFYDIYRLVSAAVDSVPFIANPTLEEILESDRLAREAVRRLK